MTTPNPNQSKNTTAFFVQAGLAFGISLFALGLAMLFLPVDPWVRAFLAMTSLFLVSSTFTLAKCVRDAQETQYVVTRLDQARVDRILAEHDPFRAAG
ncbi:YiaA/YiaB family inner membrane protein [Nocardioides pantholopis]|uniref:YiaA/YiaB family inner membrane protein n=1 Tax=Nocardioides pantholopis TaxID=2483798 RepID=UPI000F092220|nr:YiaA/YiaB family inner membrane protein [Nocardioides pantholopis]